MAQEPKKRPRQGNPPRKHHYVPVFYQQKFANEDGLLWVYDRRLHSYKELHPKVVCFQKDLYSIRLEDGPVDTRIETKVMAVIDGLGGAAIERLEAGKGLDRDSFEAFTFFAGLQHQRLPSVDRDIRSTYARAIEEVARISFSNVKRAKALMDAYAEETGTVSTVTPESMVEAVQGKRFTYEANEKPFLSNMLHIALTLSKVLGGLDMEILQSPSDSGFIICDSPFTLVPAKNNQQVGFLVPGNVKYFPISRKMCFRGGDRGKLRAYTQIDKETVRIINHNIAANSERFVMGPDRTQLEAVVKRSASEDMDNIPRFILETVESDADGSLQKISSQPRRYFYPKDGSNIAP
jgi:Protein of unknown function (DUF4238)